MNRCLSCCSLRVLDASQEWSRFSRSFSCCVSSVERFLFTASGLSIAFSESRDRSKFVRTNNPCFEVKSFVAAIPSSIVPIFIPEEEVGTCGEASSLKLLFLDPTALASSLSLSSKVNAFSVFHRFAVLENTAGDNRTDGAVGLLCTA